MSEVIKNTMFCYAVSGYLSIGMNGDAGLGSILSWLSQTYLSLGKRVV